MRVGEIQALIEPMYCESFEKYFDTNGLAYEWICNDAEGMHVLVLLADYVAWYVGNDVGGEE